MKVSLEWLKDFVDLTDITPEQIAHELTMSGLEVEEIEKTGACFTNIITAKIEKIDQHPNADKLMQLKIIIFSMLFLIPQKNVKWLLMF